MSSLCTIFFLFALLFVSPTLQFPETDSTDTFIDGAGQVFALLTAAKPAYSSTEKEVEWKKDEAGNIAGNLVNKWTYIGKRSKPNRPQRNVPSPSLGLKAAVFLVKYKGKRLRDHRILVFGGYPETGSTVRGSWIYNLRTNSWLFFSDKPQPVDRVGHALVTFCDSTVLMFGGMDNTQKLLNDTWLFDGISNRWMNPSILANARSVTPRAFHSGVSLQQPESPCSCNQSLFDFGGYFDGNQRKRNRSQALNDLWEFRCVDEKKGKRKFSWVNHQISLFSGASWPSGCFLHQAIQISKTMMFMWGGVIRCSMRNCISPARGSWSYDTVSKQWLFYAIRQPSGTNLQYDGAGAYTPDFAKILYIASRRSVYYFQKDSKKWSRLKLWDKTSPNILPADKVYPLAVAFMSKRAIVFCGANPYYYPSTVGVSVSILDESNGRWLWTLRPMPQSHPGAPEIRSWMIAGDDIVSSPFLFPSILMNYLRNCIAPLRTSNFTIRNSSKSFLDFYNDLELEITETCVFHIIGMVFKTDLWSLTLGSIWKMDLQTGTWWQNRKELPYWLDHCSPSTGWGDKGVILYCSIRSDIGKQIPMSVVKFYSHATNRLLVATPMSAYSPKARVFSSIVHITNGSFLLFGGIHFDVDMKAWIINFLTQMILEDRKRTLAYWKIPNMLLSAILPAYLNDLWLLKVSEKTDTDTKTIVAITSEWKRLGPGRTHQSRPWPTERAFHSMVVSDSKAFLLGGMRTSLLAWPPVCWQDMWYYDVKRSRWKSVKLTELSTPVFSSWKNLCEVHATVIGRRIVAVRFKHDPGTGIYEDGLVTYLPGAKRWEEQTSRQHLQPRQLLSWRQKIIFVADIPRKPRILGIMNRYLHRHDQYEIVLLSLLPGCHKGTSSPNWSERECRICDTGTYAGDGARNCTKCPGGLTTHGPGSVSLSNCTCNQLYCKYGNCFVARVDGRLTAGCECNFGYTGGRCQYPTYFIIGGVTIGVALIVFLLIISLRKMTKYRKLKRAKDMELEEMGNVWTIRSSELHLLDRIDRDTPGSFGDIYKARYRDMTVAVKKLKDIMLSGKVKSDFEREILLMRTLRHPNIVLFIGAGQFNDSCPLIVLEYLQEGSLNRIIHNSIFELKERQQIKFGLDAANGMAYLHSRQPRRIHRDLKSSNLLLSENWTVKVADFGSARLVREGRLRQSRRKNQNVFEDVDSMTRPLLQADRELSGNVGAVLWRAPEIFSGDPYGASADVYSFGIVMWEIIARAVPYEDAAFKWIAEVESNVRSGMRPTITDSIRQFRRDYQVLMAECWAGDPEERPTFAEVVERMQSILLIGEEQQIDDECHEIESSV